MNYIHDIIISVETREWRKWGFKSLLPHQLYCTFWGAIFFA